MRKNLEEIMGLQKAMEQRIGDFLKDELVEEYQVFWRELQSQCIKNTKTLGHFMVRKCNR